MLTIEEIKKFKEYQVHTRHGQRILRQRRSQEFFEGVYNIPFVKENYQMRSFSVPEMANGITQQAISTIPKVYAQPRKERKEIEDAADRVASILNKWVKVLSKQSSNPFKMTFKNIAFNRGESWVYTPHRAELAKMGNWQEDMPDEIPVHFIQYDPMVVFSDPSEFVDGKPTRVLVSYKRSVNDILKHYPDWAGGSESEYGKLVDFMFYIDNDQQYAEANNEPLFYEKNKKLANGDGRRKNIYGFIPFAHVYSGWGYETDNKDPELLAFDRIRMIEDRIVQNAIMDSAFSYNVINFAWRGRTLINKSGQEIGADAYKEYKPNEPGKLSELTLPPGADIKVEESQLFEAPVFVYRNSIKSELESAYPNVLKGEAGGSSGRQDDILTSSGLALYDEPIENTGALWAEAFHNALKVCYAMKNVGMLPPNLRENDIDSFTNIDVKLREENPLEVLRKKADGDRKYQLGIIDDLTNLTDFQGFTKEKAKQIMARKLVDDVTRNHPVFKEIMGMALAQESGMGEMFEQITGKGVNPTPQFGSEGGTPREGNVITPTGREMTDMSQERRPPRMPPGMGVG